LSETSGPDLGARLRRRRGDRATGRALVPVGQREDAQGSGILPLPPPDEPATPRPWRSGVFGALDIGSTKMTCLIGRGEPDGSLRVLGYGWRRSRGVRGGAIVDLREAEAAIRATVGQAEEAAERSLDSVVVNLSCGQPESRIFSARMPIGGREVTDSDVSRAVGEAQARAYIEGRSIVHTMPLGFSVDETPGVLDPRGHLCEQLTARLHVVDTSSNALRTLEQVLARAELKLSGLVAAPFASGLAVLDDDERELGATIVELGGGTTSLAVFSESRLLHTAFLPVGGVHVTRDLGGMLSTSVDEAERLKTKYGAAELASQDDRDMITAQLMGDETSSLARISRAKLISVIRPRVEETLELVRDRLDGAGLGRAANGRVVLTGGASLLDGIGPMAARILNRPVRLGQPQRIQGLPEIAAASTGFATVSGLLAWAAGADRAYHDADMPERRNTGVLRRIVGFMRDRV
jgi:cell division protein FtsA